MFSLKSTKGFTLIELMVVVAIITLIATAILLNTNLSRPDTELKHHAKQIGKSLTLLMQEAILEDKIYAVSILIDKVIIYEFDRGKWISSESPLFKKLLKKKEYSNNLTIDNRSVPLYQNNTSGEPQLHILILSSGEMTIFQWEIKDVANNLTVIINSNMLGEILVEGPIESL